MHVATREAASHCPRSCPYPRVPDKSIWHWGRLDAGRMDGWMDGRREGGKEPPEGCKWRKGWQRDRQTEGQTDGGWVSGWKDGRMGGWQTGTQRCGATKVWPWGCSHRGMCLWDGEWPHTAPQLLAGFPHGVGFIPLSSSGRGWAAKPHCHTGETSSCLGPTGKKSKSA